MSFSSMLQKNVTGTVSKACILMHKIPEGGIPDMSNAENRTSSYQNLVSMGEKLVSTAKSVTTMDANILNEDELAQNNFVKLDVQYNPSTLHYSSRGGTSISRSNVAANGSNAFQKDNIPYEVILNMDLIFDDTENSDAFSVLDAGSASWTGAAKKGVNALYNLATSEKGNKSLTRGHSVQDISELFVAAIVETYTRMVCVVWNKSVFWGELCGANVEYTMFNSAGNPIRSKVHLEIRQDMQVTPGVSAVTWNTAYNNLFTAANKLSSSKKLTSSSSMVSNILNLS